MDIISPCLHRSSDFCRRYLRCQNFLHLVPVAYLQIRHHRCPLCRDRRTDDDSVVCISDHTERRANLVNWDQVLLHPLNDSWEAVQSPCWIPLPMNSRNGNQAATSQWRDCNVYPGVEKMFCRQRFGCSGGKTSSSAPILHVSQLSQPYFHGTLLHQNEMGY